MTKDQRIPTPADYDLDGANLEFLQRVPPYNVWRMIARTGLAPEFSQPLAVMFTPEWFPPVDREVILFRTCRANGSTYEIPQHRVFSGLPAELVDAILDDRLDEVDPWQRTLCRISDEVALQAKATPQSVQALVAHYGSHNAACRALFIMAWFNMLTRFVDSTGVPLETGEELHALTAATGPTGVRRGQDAAE